MNALFIREQFNPWELREAPDACHAANLADLRAWSPVSCRHTSWTFAPLCRHDDRGRLIKGSRQRNPFIVGVNNA